MTAAWSYSPEQIAQIKAALPSKTEDCARRVQMAASTYAAMREGRARKPDPSQEIPALQHAAAAFYAALTTLSEASTSHLVEFASSPAYDQPLSRDEMVWTVHRFVTENSAGFANPPKLETKGRSREAAREVLLAALQDAFVRAHDGKMPARGWPAFRNLCWQPLVDAGLAANLAEKTFRKPASKRRNK